VQAQDEDLMAMHQLQEESLAELAKVSSPGVVSKSDDFLSINTKEIAQMQLRELSPKPELLFHSP